MKNYYYILGVKENSSIKEIKSAYWKLSKKFHPDINQGDKFFEERFKDIKEGYETLSDIHKRKIYDEQLKEFNKQNQTEFGERAENTSSGDEYGVEPIRMAKKSKRKNEVEEESHFIYNLISGTLGILFCLCSLYAVYDLVISPLIKRIAS